MNPGAEPFVSVDPYFLQLVEAFKADKRGWVIPRSSLRRVVVLLDNALNESPLKNIKGDFLYCDNNTTGVATVKLNNTSEDPFPLLAQAGVNNIPFDGVYISAAAQPGKVLNLWYGYRAQFVSPAQNIATIGTITNPVTITDPGYSYGTAFSSSTVLAINTALNIIAAASNVNGYTVKKLVGMGSIGTATASKSTFLAKATAPASNIDGDVLCGQNSLNLAGTAFVYSMQLEKAIKVAAGKRLDRITDVADSASLTAALYDLL